MSLITVTALAKSLHITGIIITGITIYMISVQHTFPNYSSCTGKSQSSIPIFTVVFSIFSISVFTVQVVIEVVKASFMCHDVANSINPSDFCFCSISHHCIVLMTLGTNWTINGCTTGPMIVHYSSGIAAIFGTAQGMFFNFAIRPVSLTLGALTLGYAFSILVIELVEIFDSIVGHNGFVCVGVYLYTCVYYNI